MASTISAATLTVTISESITLNGYERGSSNSLSIGSINEVMTRVITVPTSEISAINTGAENASGTWKKADIRYIRLTNKDDTNFVLVNIIGNSSDEALIKVDAGCSFILFADQSAGFATVTSFSGGALSVPSAPGDVEAMNLCADTAAVDVEIFIALV
tara:strand:+ start:47 stop:520 length:474 start_codon:yes stop_codon:yes gene_type:complete